MASILYLHGARMLTSYPVVPLFQNLAIVVGLFSYNGGLYWGINADWEMIPDLHVFIEALESSFRELQEAAGRRVQQLNTAARRLAVRPNRARRTVRALRPVESQVAARGHEESPASEAKVQDPKPKVAGRSAVRE